MKRPSSCGIVEVYLVVIGSIPVSSGLAQASNPKVLHERTHQLACNFEFHIACGVYEMLKVCRVQVSSVQVVY